MQINQATILTAIIFVIIVAVVVYLLPFLLSPLVGPLKLLWGFYVGRRRKKPIILAAYPEMATDEKEQSVKPKGLALSNAVEAVDMLVKQEFNYLEDIHKEKAASFDQELSDIQRRLKEVEQTYRDRRKVAQDNPINKIYSKTASSLNGETLKDALLLLFICFLLVVDTLIARHIFVSMKIFTAEGQLFTVNLLGKAVPIDYPTLYGLFFTIAVALLLHIVWSRKKVKSFFDHSKWAMLLGGLALVLFFVLRLITVLNTTIAQSLIEVLTLTCWIIGVIGVYWLAGEIVGEDHNYLKLLLAMSSPILLVLFILFGLPVILEMVVEWSMKGLGRTWFGLRQTRTVRRKRNDQDGYQAMKKGVYRGITL